MGGEKEATGSYLIITSHHSWVPAWLPCPALHHYNLCSLQGVPVFFLPGIYSCTGILNNY